nr:PREDICTED: esterase FE4-like [Bemisia tabaci]
MTIKLIVQYGTVFLMLCVLCENLFCKIVEINTKSGKILGTTVRARDGRCIRCFRGIPYAQPPVGDLRFKAPVPVNNSYVILNATADAPPCPQINPSTQMVIGEENCLYLNVYTPQIPVLRGCKKKLPVLFFVHGGRWLVGSSNSHVYGPEFLLAEDIVLVTINFRLGVFGFLSSGDDVAAGSWGLKDQVLALKWVQDNIEIFGGDPYRVTIMGESKGGAAVNSMFYAPSAKGLFKRCVSLSGVVQNPYSFAPLVNISTPSKKLAELVECPTEPSESLVDCMRNVDFRRLIQLESQVYPNDIEKPTTGTLWAPTVEPKSSPSPFLTIDPKLATFRPNYPWLNIINAADGGVYVAYIFGEPDLENLLAENPKLVLPVLLSLDLEFCADDIPEIVNRILRFYFGDLPVGRSTESQLVNLFSDYFFFTGVENASLNYGGEVSVYRYTYIQSVTFNSLRGDGSLKAAPTHSDVLLNFFPDLKNFPNRTYTAKDVEVSKLMVEALVSFIEDGNPTKFSSIKWSPSDLKENEIYQKAEPFLQEQCISERLKFWSTIRAEFRTKTLTDSQVC